MLTEEQIRIIQNEVWGFEADWVAIDREGYVAHFSSAGQGPVPLACLPLLDAYKAFLDALKQVTDAILVDDGEGRHDTWLNIAKCGLYSYDYLYAADLYNVHAAPVTPIHISEILEAYHPLLNTVVLSEFPFKEMRPIDFEQLDIRISWEHRWIPPSQQNVNPT